MNEKSIDNSINHHVDKSKKKSVKCRRKNHWKADNSVNHCRLQWHNCQVRKKQKVVK